MTINEDDHEARVETLYVGDTETFVVKTPRVPRARVLWLHGYSMDPRDMIPSARVLSTSAEFWLPGGPIEVASGRRSWWQRNADADNASQDAAPRDLVDFEPEGRAEARECVRRLLHRMSAEFPRRPIVLAGFSQGGMLACDVTLHESAGIAALALFSTSRIAFEQWRPRASQLLGLRVLLSHGRSDPDLAFSAGEGLRDFLGSAQTQLEWIPFDGGHIIPGPVWRRFRALLGEVGAPFASEPCHPPRSRA